MYETPCCSHTLNVRVWVWRLEDILSQPSPQVSPTLCVETGPLFGLKLARQARRADGEPQGPSVSASPALGLLSVGYHTQVFSSNMCCEVSTQVFIDWAASSPLYKHS